MNEQFWKLICFALPFWKAALAVIVALVLLSIFSFPFIQKGSSTYYIFLINIGLIVSLLTVSLYVIHRCPDR